MLIILLSSLALAGQPDALQAVPMGSLLVDAKVPAEILIDGERIGQLFVATELRVAVPAGAHTLSVVREGRPEDLTVDIVEAADTVLVVGRNGTSVGSRLEELAVQDDPDALVAVDVRVTGEARLQLRLGGSRFDLVPGQAMTLHLPQGSHPVSLRNHNGTVVWATGSLVLKGGDTAVVQLAEGRLPELSGYGRFVSTGR